MSDPVVTETPVVPAVPVAPSSSGSTPPAESVAPVNQAAADAAAAAAAKVTTPATPPAEVAYALALPKDATIEATAVDRLTTFAKDHKLAPEAAQKALDLVDAEVKADRQKQSETAREAFKKTAFEDWPQQIKDHPTLGGENHTKTLLNVVRMADQFIKPYPHRVEALNTTGFGNHPLLVEIFNDVGARMANDKLVNGNSGGGPAPMSAAEKLYGGTKANA